MIIDRVYLVDRAVPSQSSGFDTLLECVVPP
jgi:hypothetical protein